MKIKHYRAKQAVLLSMVLPFLLGESLEASAYGHEVVGVQPHRIVRQGGVTRAVIRYPGHSVARHAVKPGVKPAGSGYRYRWR